MHSLFCIWMDIIIDNILQVFFNFSTFAALRELFRAKAGNYSPETVEMAVDIGLPPSEKEEIKTEVPVENSKVVEVLEVEQLVTMEDEAPEEPSRRTSLVGFHDSDEFFDVPEPIDYDQFESEWHYDKPPEQHSQVLLPTNRLRPI